MGRVKEFEPALQKVFGDSAGSISAELRTKLYELFMLARDLEPQMIREASLNNEERATRDLWRRLQNTTDDDIPF